MGIFWNYPDQPAQPRPYVVQQFRTALATHLPADANVDQQARDLAAAVASLPPPQATLDKRNLGIAILIVFAFVGAGIGTDAVGLSTSTTSLFALATTAFGIVVGLLTGEKPSQ
jgi:hypothetical protein